MEQSDIMQALLSATGGGLAAMWGMLRWTNARIRKLELHHLTPQTLADHIQQDSELRRAMWTDIKAIAQAVARIEGYLDKQRE
mgnify:CR=1 FL=1